MTASFGALFAALYAAHMVADHWVQTQGQADRKGRPGWAGRRACTAHVVTYTLTALVALSLVGARTGLDLSAGSVTLGLAISALAHYVVDRRTPMVAMCRWLGKSACWLTRHGGYNVMDQSWHVGWLFIAALVMV